MATKQSLQRSILRALNQCGNYMLPHDALFDQVHVSFPMMTVTEFGDALRGLEEKGAIVSGRSPLDEAPRWKLTVVGGALISEGA